MYLAYEHKVVGNKILGTVIIPVLKKNKRLFINLSLHPQNNKLIHNYH